MDSESLKKLTDTMEKVAARSAAVELMVRALLHTHPNQKEAQLYAERMLGQSLAQPGLVLNPSGAANMKAAMAFLMQPPPSSLDLDT